MAFIECNLKVLMASRDLNIKKVSEKASLSRTTVSNLANNHSDGVHFETLIHLCNILDCQPGDLFTYHNINVDINNDYIKGEINANDLYKDFKSSQNSLSTSNRLELHLMIDIDYEDIEHNIELPVTLVGYYKSEGEFYHEVNFDKQFNKKLKSLKFPHSVEKYLIDQITDFIIEEVSEVTEYDIGYGPVHVHFDFSNINS